jgi:hypothetical protein
MGIKPVHNPIARSGPTNIKEVGMDGQDGGLSSGLMLVLHRLSVVLTGPFEHDGHSPAYRPYPLQNRIQEGCAAFETPSAETPLSAVHNGYPWLVDRLARSLKIWSALPAVSPPSLRWQFTCYCGCSDA